MNSSPIKVHYESIDSTNNKAKDIVLSSYTTNADGSIHFGDVLPLLVTAGEQTSGRGRYGKMFYSPAGSGVYLSYAYEYNYSTDELLQVTTKVADLILPVLQAHTSQELHIKPINDIYSGARKIAGILTERVDYPNSTIREVTGDNKYFIIIGIGINCEIANIPLDLYDTEGERLCDKIGFLEPDCSHEQLIDELCEAMEKLHTTK